MIRGTPFFYPDILKGIGATDPSEEKFPRMLAAHLAPFGPFLGRKGHRPHMVAMAKGLLGDLGRKNLESIALAFHGGRGERNLANFMTRSLFGDEGMLGGYQKELGGMPSAGGGLITGGGRGFPKKGRNSVGVARQYRGPLGKKDGCQAGVMVGHAGSKGHGPLDYALYMPGAWFGKDRAALRERRRVPGGLGFKTKNLMPREMICKAVASGTSAANTWAWTAPSGTTANSLTRRPREPSASPTPTRAALSSRTARK
jgi:SRSO17 transposase